MAQEHAGAEASWKARLCLAFSFEKAATEGRRGRGKPETKGRFQHPRDSARLADMGPERPGPCGEVSGSSLAQAEGQRVLPGPFGLARDKRGQR